MQNENLVSDIAGTKARALVLGCACIILSSLSLEDLMRYCVYHPDALRMKDDKGEEIFSIDLDDSPGSISSEGAVFSNVSTGDGKATITCLISPKMKDRREMILDKYGTALRRLDELEARLRAGLPELDEIEKNAWAGFGEV